MSAPERLSSPAPPRMATPARADRITVEELLRWAKEGRLRLPSFQRKLRWGADDKWMLLDSMERGYPIGTLLLWKRPVYRGGSGSASGPSAPTPPASASYIGAPLFRGPAPPESGNVYLIVDGQQRISTLWEALALTPEADQPTILFDMAKEAFVVRALRPTERGPTAPAGDTNAPPALPLSLSLDAVALAEWVPPGLPRDIKLRYYEVGKRLREYIIPIYVVEGDDIESLRHIFDRTNSTGKSLTRDEVFDALVGSRIDPDAAGNRGLDHVVHQLRDLDFGALAPAAVLKALEAIKGEKVGKLNPRELDPKTAESDLSSAERALRKTVLFLQSIGVPHADAVPYELPLVALARLFHLYESPDEKSLVLLRRWFWRGAVSERHGGSSGSLQQHIDDIHPKDERGSVKRLLDRSGAPQRPDFHIITRGAITISSARSKVALCALFSHTPRSLVSGDKITPEQIFEDPKNDATLTIVPPKGLELGSAICNRLLHPRAGVAPSRLVIGCNDEGALASHGIDRAMQRALRQGDTETFLRRRADVLEEWIAHFVDARAEWERPDTPSIRALAKGKRAP